MDLGAVKYALTGVTQDPVISVPGHVVINRELKHVSDGVVHELFDLTHPVLNLLFLGVKDRESLDELLFSGVHTRDGLIRLELKFNHVFEHLSQVRLHLFDVLGLRQNFEQLIIGQEVETGEDGTLSFEVILKTLLDAIEIQVHGFNGRKHGLLVTKAGGQSVGVLLGTLDNFSPVLIDLLEALSLTRKLLHDIGGVENGLQVLPLLLALDPLFDCVGNIE